MTPYLLEIFASAAAKYAISLHLLVGVAAVESNYDKNAIAYHDGKGGYHSYGLFQVQYPTAKFLGYREDKYCLINHINKCGLLDPKTNTEYAARYLAYQLKRYGGDEKKAISAYNAGSYIKGNKSYVKKVKTRMNEYAIQISKFTVALED